LSENVHRIVLMLVTGMSEEATLAAATAKLKLSAKAAAAAIVAARQHLARLANYDWAQELATAIARLNDCYTVSRSINDIKTCVQAQLALVKLMRLNEPDTRESAAGAASPRDAELDLVRQHLEPLLDTPNASVVELARLLAGELISHRGNQHDPRELRPPQGTGAKATKPAVPVRARRRATPRRSRS
jgi:hypothetical protein